MREKLVITSIFVANLNFIIYNTLALNGLYKDGLRIITVVLLMLSFLVNKKILSFNRIDLVWILLLLTSLFSFNINSNVFNFIYIILMLIASKSISTEVFMKKNFKIALVSALIVFVFLQLGITDNIQYSVFDRERSTFGFTNVNAFSGFVYSFSILYLVSRREVRWYHLVTITSLVFFFYTFTDSRTSTAAFMTFVISYISLNVLFKKFSRYAIFLKISMLILALVPLLLSLLSPILLINFQSLDFLTSYRLSINTRYITSNEVINFFFGGTFLDDIDNGYLTLIYSIGFLFSSLIIFFILRALIVLVDNKDSMAIAFIISFLFFNAFESLFIRPELSVTICFWILVYRNLINGSNIANDKKSYTKEKKNCEHTYSYK